MGKNELEELPEEHDLPEEESSLHKVIVLIIGLFLVLLMLSYTFTSFPIGDIFAGMLESDSLIESGIEGKFSIKFLNKTDDSLLSLYYANQKEEISVCLTGHIQEGKYYVTDLYQSETVEQSFAHVRFKPCSTDTIILLHTHPYKRCIASEQDVETLQSTKQYNPSVLMIVMCSPDQYSVYG